jgi:hypothetical protein
MANGVIGGSTVMQFLWSTYSGVAAQATQQLVGDILPVMAGVTLAAIQLVVIIFGANMLTGKMDFSEGVRRIVTCVIVSALMVPATFNQYVTTTLTQSIPNTIASAVAGAQGLQGAQGFDALVNQITHVHAQLSAQMIGILYIGDRVALWVVALVAKCLIVCCFAVWAIASLSVFFIVPLLAFLAPTFLFNATRGFGERWVGKVVSLLLVQTITLMVAATVVKAEGVWFQQTAATLPAGNGPDQGFQMNGGDLSFTGFSEVGAVGNATGDAGAAQQAASLNGEAGIEVMIGMILTLIFGFFLLATTTRIAYGIGASSGFSAAPIVNGVTNLTTNIVRAGARAAGKTVR